MKVGAVCEWRRKKDFNIFLGELNPQELSRYCFMAPELFVLFDRIYGCGLWTVNDKTTKGLNHRPSSSSIIMQAAIAAGFRIGYQALVNNAKGNTKKQ
jgi:hypothetical protein